MSKNCGDSDSSESEEIFKQLEEDSPGRKEFNTDDLGQVIKQQDDSNTHRNSKDTDDKTQRSSKDSNLPEENQRSRQVNRKLGSTSFKEEDMGNEWIYLNSTVPDFMKCKICSGVLESPQLLSCCGTNICKKCMNRHLQRLATLANQQQSCPFCRSTEFQLIDNNALEHSINQLRVKCCYQHKGCGWTGILQNGNLHLKECAFVPIDCPNGCGCEQFSRCKISDHMLVCPHTRTICSFETIGCDMRVPCVRLEAQKHANDFLSEHLLLVAQKNTELLKDFRHFCTFPSCKPKVTNDEYIKSQRAKLASTQHIIKTLKESLQEIKKRTASVKAEVREEEICSAEIKKRITQTKNIETTYKETIVHLGKIHPVPEATGLSYPPVTFTIDNFKKRIKLKDMWLSPPFYTHVGGYKMCLSVYPDGCVSTKRYEPRFVSVYIHFLKGEFDQHLVWPFPGAIFTITAINQRANKCNKSANLELDGRDTQSRQNDPCLGFDFGAPDFLSHSHLSAFLSRDNCLKVMVYRIQFLP